MKKIFLIVIVLIVFSCEISDLAKNDDSNNTIVYKREKKYVSTESIFDNHITSIVKIDTKSDIWKNINNILVSKGLDNLLDLNSINLYHLDNTDAVIYSIKSLNDDFNIVIYELDDNYLFQKIIKTNIENLKHFASYDLDNKLLIEMDFNTKNEIGHKKIGNGNILYGAIINKTYNTKIADNDDYSTSCPATTDNFGDCMDCAIQECFDDWVCAIAMGVNPELVFPTFMVVCGLAQI